MDEWWHAIRAARQAPARVFVVMHLFGGERRKEDVHDFVERLAEEAGVRVLMTTVDLATDHRWDLANEETQHELMSMMSGYVDLLLLGPSCSTVSRARRIRNHVGVRPVRFRNCFWGRRDLNRMSVLGYKKRIPCTSTAWPFVIASLCTGEATFGNILKTQVMIGTRPFLQLRSSKHFWSVQEGMSSLSISAL